ncbi:MAG: electron transfer flavoprotein subunit beta/FixA family protein [Deltaproteobacteria bacterium]
MDVIVCAKWVPDTSEADLAVAKGEADIEKDDLDFDVNNWDRFAIEEAVRIKEKIGGKVTVVTIAPEDAEEMLRESLARGADEAFLLSDDSFEGSDGYVSASILSKFIKKRPYDLILTGTQADDDCAGQMGGMLGAMLEVPHATLVHELNVQDGKLGIVRELEGGLSEALELDLPAVISVATGLNEPRFVSIRAVRKVAGMEIPTLGLDDVGMQESEVGTEGSRIHVERVFLPPEEEGAEIIGGSAEEAAARLAQILKERGGIG